MSRTLDANKITSRLTCKRQERVGGGRVYVYFPGESLASRSSTFGPDLLATVKCFSFFSSCDPATNPPEFPDSPKMQALRLPKLLETPNPKEKTLPRRIQTQLWLRVVTFPMINFDHWTASYPSTSSRGAGRGVLLDSSRCWTNLWLQNSTSAGEG
ncbi:hypothetical protein BX600DRAFT_310988 [Xylariales sp. PMI_506]|nr:hypothetical protein BX600DRAFT_310988 [Xylariales sp. PMI_506]